MDMKIAYPLGQGEAQPRVIVHGGAGNITRKNLPPKLWERYKAALTEIERSTRRLILGSSCTNALDAACHAVHLLEANPLFNAGVGAVFSRSGTIELEASVMVSRGHIKRGAAVSLIKHVKSPISLAAEMLRQGDSVNGGGAQSHVHLSGAEAEELARQWGLDMCEERYFWTKKRWQEHKRGLQRGPGGSLDVHDALAPVSEDGDLSWDDNEYLAQGTVGCVVADRFGMLCVATSTGGLTNKLAGRIGDTPTFGAGFWAEEYYRERILAQAWQTMMPPTLSQVMSNVLLPLRALADCLPIAVQSPAIASSNKPACWHTAVALGGTGNGDSFLRLSAARTAAARARFNPSSTGSLARAVEWVAGPGGELQRSAGDRWGKSGEGEGGIIGKHLFCPPQLIQKVPIVDATMQA